MEEGCLRKDTDIPEGKGVVFLSWAHKEGRQGIQAHGTGVFVGPWDLPASESWGAERSTGLLLRSLLDSTGL